MYCIRVEKIVFLRKKVLFNYKRFGKENLLYYNYNISKNQ